MKAEKDKKTGKWLIQYHYTDWQGKRRKSTKRGFATKREAEEWLRNFLIVNVNIKMYKKWKIKMYILSVNLPLNSTQKVVSYL
ncbi:Arm DNA-binding domain-containing protein [Eubacterium album]|uniref:Arm DNA-binding domain-containing protein n=1 Tax=Eubacterium album TaxID=2978477 RepID=UPI0032048618